MVIAAAAVGALPQAEAPAAAIRAAAAVPCVAWTGSGQPPDPGGAASNNFLSGVAVLSPCNAWAVGGDDPGQTLIAHWDGESWAQVPGPEPAQADLRAISAVSASNIWAVGEYYDGTADRTLTVHWNGSAWTQVPSPSANGSRATVLTAVSGTSATDVWAVGSFENGGGFDQTYTLHWDGSSWTHVPSPHPGGTTHDQNLEGVSGVSAKDVWAVGSWYDGTADQSLALHWDGTSWKQVPSPDPGPQGTDFNGVRAVSASNAWAVGSSNEGTSDRALITHWNGTSWTQVAAPNPGGAAGSVLNSVAVTSANDAWAVGAYVVGTGRRTLAVHWDGSAWTQAATPDLGGAQIDDFLAAGGTGSPGGVWAVGYYYTGTVNQTMAFHCC